MTKQQYIIGVISDTHGEKIPEVLLNEFNECDLIIHAGDIGKIATIEELSQIAPVIAVAGNSEGDVRARLPKIVVLQFFNWRFVVTHVILSGAKKTYEKQLKSNILDEYITILFPSCDVVIFGHTHQPLVKKTRERLYINSGAICKPRKKPSIAKLFVTRKNIKVKFYKDKKYTGPICDV